MNAHLISWLGNYRHHSPYDEWGGIKKSLLHLHSESVVGLGA